MQAKLVVVGGDAKAAVIRLKLPAIVGRGRNASLTLPHPLVSRQHCEIVESNGQLLVRDLGSLNGTFIGRERITEAVLPPGELLTIGTVTFRAVYEPAGDEPPQATAPAPGAQPAAGSPPKPNKSAKPTKPADTLDFAPAEEVAEPDELDQGGDAPRDFVAVPLTDSAETHPLPESPAAVPDEGVPSAESEQPPEAGTDEAADFEPPEDVGLFDDLEKAADTEPAGTEPAGTEPADAESAHTESAHTESAHTESAHTESAHTESAHTESAHTESVGGDSDSDIDLLHDDSSEELHLGEIPEEESPESKPDGATPPRQAAPEAAEETSENPFDNLDFDAPDTSPPPSVDSSSPADEPNSREQAEDADDDLQSFLKGLQ